MLASFLRLFPFTLFLLLFPFLPFFAWVARLTSFFQIAESYWHLHTQHRSAFTQELDLRPFVEKF